MCPPHRPLGIGTAATRKPKGYPDFGNRRVDHTRRAGIVQAIATMISENTATVR